MTDKGIIQLQQIEINTFNPELFLQNLIFRGQVAYNLSQLLDTAIANKLIDDQNNQYNLQVLKVCVILYNYYILQQGTNFLNQQKYAGMANQLKKIFQDENEYKQQIFRFSQLKTNSSQQLRQNLLNLFMKCLEQKNGIPQEFSKIVNYFKKVNKIDLKFERLQQQLSVENQINYDIYQYYFMIFFSQEWFSQNEHIQSVKLLSYIKSFLNFDYVYPIEQYADQTLIFRPILDDQPIEYYRNIIEQK